MYSRQRLKIGEIFFAYVSLTIDMAALASIQNFDLKSQKPCIRVSTLSADCLQYQSHSRQKGPKIHQKLKIYFSSKNVGKHFGMSFGIKQKHLQLICAKKSENFTNLIFFCQRQIFIFDLMTSIFTSKGYHLKISLLQCKWLNKTQKITNLIDLVLQQL